MILSPNHTSIPMPSRLTGYFYAKKWAYRYSFNGQERDDEIAGTGNIMTAEFWEYDTRLGRRWNIDPILDYNVSPYSVLLNCPIFMMDPDGDEPTPDGKPIEKEKPPIWILSSGEKYKTTVTGDGNGGVIVNAPKPNQTSQTKITDGYGETFRERLSNLPKFAWDNILFPTPKPNVSSVTLGEGLFGWITPGANSVKLIGIYSKLRKLTKGYKGAIQAHHIVEVRHLKVFGLSINEAPAIILSRLEHQQITKRLYELLPKGYNYTRAQIIEAYKTAYKAYPEWVEAAEQYLK